MLQVAIVVFGVAAAATVLWAATRRQRRGMRQGDVADLFEAVEVRIFIKRIAARRARAPSPVMTPQVSYMKRV